MLFLTQEARGGMEEDEMEGLWNASEDSSESGDEFGDELGDELGWLESD